MAKNELHPCLTYGLSHSKEYVPSVVSPFLVDKDSEGKFIKRHSDAYLLLRQKNIEKTIGVQSIRNYLDMQQAAAQRSSVDTTQLSDDDILQLIEPREINNLTTAYEYAQYLQKNSKEVSKNLDKIKTQKEQYNLFAERYHLKDK